MLMRINCVYEWEVDPDTVPKEIRKYPNLIAEMEARHVFDIVQNAVSRAKDGDPPEGLLIQIGVVKT